jgi:tetratricopeptide (TPR) repeat protein
MERHLSPAALGRLFSGQMVGAETEIADAHLVRCRQCLDLAAAVAAKHRKDGALVRLTEERSAALRLLEAEEQTARRRLLAHCGWAELKDLAVEEQRLRLKRAPELQTLEMFQTVVAAASAAGPDDPFLGEERAFLAHILAGLLPDTCCPAALRRDLQGQAMLVAADCRRLARNWRDMGAALKAARSHFEQGTGDPVWDARCLAVQAALATDRGHLERAQAGLTGAAEIFRAARDASSLASVRIQEARTLMAAGRWDEALEQAEDALRWARPGDLRLQALARSLATECLAVLGRPGEALRSHIASPPGGQSGERHGGLRSAWLAALLLDGLGHGPDAEKAYRAGAAGYQEEELYQEAFLTLLALFGSLVRRKAWDKAARVCEDACALAARPGTACPSQVAGQWRDLLARARARKVSAEDLLAARRLLVLHWHVPAQRALPPLSPLPQEDGPATGSVVPARAAAAEPAPRPAPSPAPPAPDRPRDLRGLDAAIEHYDRQLIARALERCGGCILETSRFLDITRNTLKAKIRLYGLESAVRRSSDEPEGHPALSDAERQEVERLRAWSGWAELKKLPAARQIERLQKAQALQTREMFDTILAAASAAALDDPARGEELALVARALAGLLPKSWCSEALRHDLFGDSLRVVGNCRRLSGDWAASANILAEARGHLDQGTGDPRREARLLSVEASLAADTWKIDRASDLLARAAAIYRRAQDVAAFAAITLQEAGTLLAAGCYEEAMARAEDILRRLSPKEARLEILARSIVTECLAFLGRPTEALRSLAAAWPLYEGFQGRRTEPQRCFLEALVLDVLGYIEKAEAVYRHSVAGYMEAELYKDAFLTMLTRFEILFRRGAWDQAARACEEALALEEQIAAPGHEPMIGLWRDLLTLVTEQRLTEQRVQEARHAVVLHWSSPAAGARPAGRGAVALRWDGNGSAAPNGAARSAGATGGEPEQLLAFHPATPPRKLAAGTYKDLMESYDCRIIEEGLTRCGGRIKPTARLLGIARTTLEKKIEKYGLSSVA